MKKTFWTDAEGFSIIDLLAISYSAVYLILVISNIPIQNVKLTDLLGTMTSPILIILGGYFTGQAVQQYNTTRPYRNDALIQQAKDDIVKPNIPAPVTIIPQPVVEDPGYSAPDEIKNQPYYKGSNKGADPVSPSVDPLIDEINSNQSTDVDNITTDYSHLV